MASRDAAFERLPAVRFARGLVLLRHGFFLLAAGRMFQGRWHGSDRLLQTHSDAKVDLRAFSRTKNRPRSRALSMPMVILLAQLGDFSDAHARECTEERGPAFCGGNVRAFSVGRFCSQCRFVIYRSVQGLDCFG
jgi:hypothetical protein